MLKMESDLTRHQLNFDLKYQKQGEFIKDISDLNRITGGSEMLTLYLHNSVKGRILKNMKLRKGIKVLDAGCGRGFFLQKLVKFYNKKMELYGLDISNVVIRNAKLNLPTVRFIVSSIEKTPFNNEFFDCVVCSEVLEHVYNPCDAIREIARITKKEGQIIFTTPNFHSILFRGFRLLEMLNLSRFFSKKGLTEKDEEIPLEDLIFLAKKNGLIIDKIDYISPLLIDYTMLNILPSLVLKMLIKLSISLESFQFQKSMCNQLNLYLTKK